jgi:hypothetical protein
MASGEDTSAENEKDENFLPPLDKHPTTAIVVIFSSWLEPTPGRFRPRMAVRSETKAVNGYFFFNNETTKYTKSHEIFRAFSCGSWLKNLFLGMGWKNCLVSVMVFFS